MFGVQFNGDRAGQVIMLEDKIMGGSAKEQRQIVYLVDGIQVALPHPNDAQMTHWTSLNIVTEFIVFKHRNIEMA
ncbi:hypothetical protein N7537_010395 [Penicillium hordei]|uniref:Uncharacterized protein n=1 Tax=Penicillium hordei TaxID=40994 RepID=A0AAD6GVM3_9EURO|nr:uncharacterized protein N7537_010395 [Penicillium hordei]KAJ5593491.1 hypothetical protein N7537_010395 [Penicillium hordei]